MNTSYRLRKTRTPLLTLALPGLIAFGLMGCDKEAPPQVGEKPNDSTQTKPRVCTTFYPTTFFAERIGGDKIDLACPCPPDADPAFWLPDAKAIETYQSAGLIIVNGASFEKWLGKVTLPESRIVDTTKPLAAEFIVMEDTVSHSHGPEGAHTHEGVDGHTWLDPINAKTQAAEIEAAFIKRDPKNEPAYKAGFTALATDLDALDARLKKVSPRMIGQTLLCNHPAYNYLARRYGWKVRSFHLDPETVPDDETFAEIKAFQEKQPASFILWEAKPLPEIARRFRTELGVESIVFSPCEGLEAEELANKIDFLSVMNDNLDRLERAFPATEQSKQEPQ